MNIKNILFILFLSIAACHTMEKEEAKSGEGLHDHAILKIVPTGYQDHHEYSPTDPASMGDDVFQYVLWFLAPTDLLQVNCVSKEWQRHTDDDVLWKAAFKYTFPQESGTPGTPWKEFFRDYFYSLGHPRVRALPAWQQAIVHHQLPEQEAYVETYIEPYKKAGPFAMFPQTAYRQVCRPAYRPTPPKWRELNLSHNGMLRLLPDINQFTRLRDLTLTNNKLTHLPIGVLQLTALERLDFGYNKISAFPLELCELTNLKSLDFTRNILSSIPNEVGRLTQLQYFYLDNNRITSLPSTVNQLILLKELKFDWNPIESWPQEFMEFLENVPNGFHLDVFMGRHNEWGNLRDLITKTVQKRIDMGEITINR